MAELAPVLKQRFLDANGDPLVGGKLYSYVANTTTPRATYTDQSGATPNTNPVILDANGEASVWLGNYPYKFVLTDANDVVQWTTDDVKSLATRIEEAVVVAGGLSAANNLSDLGNVSTALTNLGTSSTAISYINGLTSDAQTQLNGKQPLDSDLTAVAGLSTTGLVVRTGAGTATTRSLAAGSSKITIGNADGVSGNPSVDVTEANLTLGNLGGTLGTSKGGTGQNLSGSTGAISVSAGTVSAGTLSIGNGGTGQTTATAAFDALSPNTTKGDITVRTSTSNVRLPIGTDAYVLTADSAQTNGLKWAPAGTASPLTTKGDVYTYSTTNDRLAVGSNGQVLTVDSSQSTGIKWARPSGAGSKNYLGVINGTDNGGDFEGNTVGSWVLGNSTLDSTLKFPNGTPTFGSGASGNLAGSIVSSGQLAGSYSYSYASSAATTAGNFLASPAFAVDIEDQAKVLTFRFAYKAVTNPSNATWSGTNTNSFGVAIYDVTTGGSSGWIMPAGCFAMTQSSGVGICTGTFQTTSSSTQYRLVVYNANATSGAVTVYFDDFSVSPTTTVMGCPVTDWVAYTPTTTNITVGNGTQTAYWHRVGDSIEVVYNLLLGSTSAMGTNPTVAIPSGYTVDTAKLQAAAEPIVGVLNAVQTGTKTYTGVANYGNTTAVNLRVNATSDSITSTNPFTWANGHKLNVFFRVPISGWSSNVAMSNDTDTRSVLFRGTQSSQALTADTTNIAFTAATDTHAGWTGTTYVVPVSGDYFATLVAYTGSTCTIDFYKNAVNQFQFSATNAGQKYGGFGLLPGLKAGDVLSWRANASVTMTNGVLAIWRNSGPATIAATESVNARYTSTAGQAFTNTATILDFPTKDNDSHSAVTTGASWNFRAPTPGRYRVTAFIQTAAFTGVVGQGVGVDLYKNGSFFSKIDGDSCETASASITKRLTGSDEVLLNANDTIDLRIIKDASITVSVSTTAGRVRVAITRVGN